MNSAPHDRQPLTTETTEVAEAWPPFPSTFQISHECIWLFLSADRSWEYFGDQNNNKDAI